MIFFLSHQSDPPGVEVVPNYIVHFFEYGFFGLAVLLGVTSTFSKRLIARRALITVLIASLYGATDEFHQSFIPGREASFQDLVADTLGAVVFTIAIYLVKVTRQTP